MIPCFASLPVSSDSDSVEYDEDLDWDPFSDDLSGVDPLAGFAAGPIATQKDEQEEVRKSKESTKTRIEGVCLCGLW